MLGAALLRLWDINARGLWADEGYSAMVAAHADPAEWSADTHPPLYPALLSAWRLIHDDDLTLRLLSVLFGVATLPFVYGIGRRLLGERAALWATAVLAVLPAHVHYSREVRCYSLMTFLFAAGWWAGVRIASRPSAGALAAYVVAAALLCYSHALGAAYCLLLTLLAAAQLLAVRAPRATWVRFLAASAVAGLLFAPWLATMLLRTRQVMESFWIPVPSPAAPVAIPLYVLTVSPLAAALKDAVTPPDADRWLPAARFALVVPVVALVLLVLFRWQVRQRGAVLVLLAAVFLPPAALYLAGLVGRPLLLVRAVLPAAIPLALLLGLAGTVGGRWRPVAVGLLAVVLAELTLGSLAGDSYSPAEGWREASWHLQNEVGRDDAILVFVVQAGDVMTDTGAYLLRRYDLDGRLRGHGLTNLASTLADPHTVDTERLRRLLAGFRPGQTVWIVDRSDLFRPAAGRLVPEAEAQSFGQITVTRYVMPGQPPGRPR